MTIHSVKSALVRPKKTVDDTGAPSSALEQTLGTLGMSASTRGPGQPGAQSGPSGQSSGGFAMHPASQMGVSTDGRDQGSSTAPGAGPRVPAPAEPSKASQYLERCSSFAVSLRASYYA